MRYLKLALLGLLLAVPVALAARAEAPMHHGPLQTPDAAPMNDPFAPIMMRMHAAMPAPTGDIDRDFIAGMIPHHQAAIEMAEAELAQGQDPKVQALARKIIRAQQAEITQMQAWLKAY